MTDEANIQAILETRAANAAAYPEGEILRVLWCVEGRAAPASYLHELESNTICRIDSQDTDPGQPGSLSLTWSSGDFEAFVAATASPLNLVSSARVRFRHHRTIVVDKAWVIAYLQTLQGGWDINPERIAQIEDKSAGPCRQIDRRLELSRDEFHEQFASRGKPLIVNTAAIGIRTKWQCFDDLLACAGHCEVPVHVANDAGNEAFKSRVNTITSQSSHYQVMRLAEVIALSISRSKDDPGQVPYGAGIAAPAEIASELGFPDYFPASTYIDPKMWIGPAGTVMNMHRDMVDNFLVQILGRKRVTLVSPTKSRAMQAQNVGIHKYYHVSFRTEEDCRREQLEPLVFELSAGETLYIPAGWWHQVGSLEPSFSVNYFALKKIPEVLRQ